MVFKICLEILFPDGSRVKHFKYMLANGGRTAFAAAWEECVYHIFASSALLLRLHGTAFIWKAGTADPASLRGLRTAEFPFALLGSKGGKKVPMDTRGDGEIFTYILAG